MKTKEEINNEFQENIANYKVFKKFPKEERKAIFKQAILEAKIPARDLNEEQRFRRTVINLRTFSIFSKIFGVIILFFILLNIITMI